MGNERKRDNRARRRRRGLGRRRRKRNNQELYCALQVRLGIPDATKNYNRRD